MPRISRISVQKAWRRMVPGIAYPCRGDFRVIELAPIGDSRIFAARVNNSGMPVMIVDVPASDCPSPFSDSRTPCISWSSHPYGSDRVHLILELKHPLLSDVFGALAGHVHAFICQERDRFPPAVSARIAFERWHRLFNPASDGLPPGFPNVDSLKWALLGAFPTPSTSGDPDVEIPF